MLFCIAPISWCEIICVTLVLERMLNIVFFLFLFSCQYIVSNHDAKRRKTCLEDANNECNGSGKGTANEHVNSGIDASSTF